MEKERATILVADDNPDIRRLIKVNLQFEGYQTLIARDGKETLEIARKNLPDLIVLDVLMPELDGWEVLSNLKNDKRTRDIPVILLTGVSMKEGKERGLIEGVEDYLSKPFNPLRLLEIVDEIILARKVTSAGMISDAKPIGVGLIGQEESALDVVKTLSGSSAADLLAFCDVSRSESSAKLAGELGVACFAKPEEILESQEIELIIDLRDSSNEDFDKKLKSRNIEVIKGSSVIFFQRLLNEQEVTRRKERSLVKELNNRVKELSIFNEMAQMLDAPLDLWFLLDKIAVLATRVSSVDACAIMMYDEEQEKFVVSNTLGLTPQFKEKVKLSLSDPIVEELMTLRRPLVISQFPDWKLSSLVKQTLQEGMKSFATIPLFSNQRLMGIILVFSNSQGALNQEKINLLSILAGQAGVSVENARLYDSTRKKQHLVEKLLSKLIQAQEEERKLIAAEIHDTIAQSLVGIHTRIQTCRSLLKKAPEKLEDQLNDLKKMVGDSVKEVRQIIFNLRPSTLDELGLVPSLENFIKRFEKEHKINVEFMINVKDRRLPSVVETAIFRIIQEALANIRKHSGGTKALVWLDIEPKHVNLRVADDGKGFNWEQVTDKFLRGDSHGIQGMKERVSLLGGTFKVSAEEHEGCRVSATIPLSRKSDSAYLEKVDQVLEDLRPEPDFDQLKGVASFEK